MARALCFASAAFASCWGLPGCQDEEAQARRAEAAVLVHAINQLRDAPNEAKRPWFKALEGVPCSRDDLCELKRVCSNAYERHLRALDSARSLRHVLDGDAGPAPAASTRASAKLADDAQRYLERARYLGRRCAQLQGRVERSYGL